MEAHICLEDHRLMIDRAIDKFKGELLDKEKVIIEPMLLRQRKLREQNEHFRIQLEKRMNKLESLVLSQTGKINDLLRVHDRGTVQSFD